MTRLACLVVLVMVVLPSASPGALAAQPDTEKRSARAQQLSRDARRSLYEESTEGRRRAIRFLEEAVVLAPDDPTMWHQLGEAYAGARYGARSRACFERALAIQPRDPGAWFLSGMAWRREWLRRLEPSALERAIAAFDTCTRLDPEHGEAWLRLAGMLYERRDVPAAFAAAGKSKDRGPYPDHNALALAYLTFRIGDIAGADTLFARVLPRIDAPVRRLFEEPWLVLGGAVDLHARRDTSAGRGVRFWEQQDPDPTTPENEFRLEYWARVAHAFLLFDDPLEPRFDARAMTYVQYGPPATVTFTDGTFQAIQMLYRDQYNKSLASYPYFTQLWEYPHYGMRIWLDDRALVGRYERRTRRADDPASNPDEAALSAQPDVVAIDGGAGVFTLRPPRSQRLALRTLHSRFEGSRAKRLLSQVRVRASRADSVVARWLVVDAAGREMARQVQSLDLSACAPESLGVARFSAELPAGDYRVHVSTSDRRHRRAVHQEDISLPGAAEGIGLSDIVGVCSEPSTQVQGGAVVLEASEDSRVQAGHDASCYFEISRLASASPGRSRFQYRYRLQRIAGEAGTDGAPGVGHILREYTSEEIDVDGSLRRQFVTVPTRALPQGRYRLTILVRDLVAGLEVERAFDFEQEGPT